jgi:hypothetical protein
MSFNVGPAAIQQGVTLAAVIFSCNCSEITTVIPQAAFLMYPPKKEVE